MARLRASWRTSLPVVQQPRNPQSESIARTPYQTSPEERRSRRTTTGDRPRSWWSEGRGPRGTRARTARAGLRTGQACQRGWTAYGTLHDRERRNGSPRSSTMSPPNRLRTAFFALRRQAAPGVDGLTWQAYEADLDRRIEGLHERVHRGADRALPARRGFIPKADGSQRPLAIAALEDKIVQRATAAVLNA